MHDTRISECLHAPFSSPHFRYTIHKQQTQQNKILAIPCDQLRNNFIASVFFRLSTESAKPHETSSLLPPSPPWLIMKVDVDFEGTAPTLSDSYQLDSYTYYADGGRASAPITDFRRKHKRDSKLEPTIFLYWCMDFRRSTDDQKTKQQEQRPAHPRSNTHILPHPLSVGPASIVLLCDRRSPRNVQCVCLPSALLGLWRLSDLFGFYFS